MVLARMCGMERLVANFERFYCTKFRSMEENERHVAKSLVFITDFFVAKVGALGIALMPVLVLGVEEWRPIHALLLLWGACESWFLIYQVNNKRVLEKRELGFCDSVKRAAAIEKILEHLGDPEDSAEQLLRKWQMEEVESKSCIAHFVEFLVWMFFNKPVEALTTEEFLESNIMLHRFREKLNLSSIHQGKQGNRIKFIRLSLDHLDCAYKSLMFYLVSLMTDDLILRQLQYQSS
ncbi:hypothetical protein DSO57_1036934 [Entomophthora muscae]|uniref:Uncharacterized protein n=1 Tax=Entomophthora muscae TaxID=34485 RepID=A0ACC2T9V0_9FUNG|nr:hypothetical protein DSO57_1036934 [Entomophthora muscae]